MSQAFGNAAYFGWKEQSSFDTAATPPNKWLWAESIPAPESDRKQMHKALLGTVSRKAVVQEKHAPALSGLKFPFLVEGVEQLIKHAMGGVSTTGPSGSIYTHTFALAAALPAAGLSAYVDINDANISGDHVQRITGCQIDKLTLTQEIDQTLDVEIDLVGREYTDVARTSPTMPSYAAWDYAMMTTALIGPGGTNLDIPLRKLKIEINNNLYKESYRLTGAGKRNAFGRAGQRQISIEFEIEYESDDVINYFKSAGNVDLQFKWVSSSNELTIATPAGWFQGNRPGAGDSGPVFVNMNYDPVMSSADNDELSIVLKNTISSV